MRLTAASRRSVEASSYPARWSTVPFYVVGQSTASALKELENLYAGIGFSRLDIRGESSGTAEQLAHFILNDPTSRSGQLLYLTGDKNCDTLPNILSGSGIELHPLRVYETQGSSTFEQELLVALESIPKGECTSFAPLCVMLTHLIRSFCMVDRLLCAIRSRVCDAHPSTSLRLLNVREKR